jgi:hypothetical protein
MKPRLLSLTLALLLLATPAAAMPDSGGSAVTAKPYLTSAQAAAFAKQVEYDLAAKGAHVAIVFRAGRPRKDMPKDVAYTHAAFWVYGDIKGGDGKTYQGYSVYNLYQGDGKTLPVNQSYLAQDFPFDFINGSQTDDVAVIIPTPEMQARIMAVVASPAYQALHVPSYTLVSNPFDPVHQNCTEFVLDVVAAAAWQTSDYATIKADLKAHFRPSIIRTNVLQRVFAPMVDRRLNLDDQPGAIQTATYESISAFMKDNGQTTDIHVLIRKDEVAAR